MTGELGIEGVSKDRSFTQYDEGAGAFIDNVQLDRTQT